MKNSFRIDFEWQPRDYGNEVDRLAFADLAIYVDGHIATQVEDTMAKTVRSKVRVSAHVLALWFAANWWRLRWEPADSSISWKMSHKVGAAGGGYVWPDLAFSSDGCEVLAHCRSTGYGKAETIRFLSDFDVPIQAEKFERGIEDFIEAIVERLRTRKHRKSDLSSLWAEICKERNDPEIAGWRKLEAISGFDPDEAPTELMEGLKNKGSELGNSAIEEVAAAAKTNALENLDILTGEARIQAVSVKVPEYESLNWNVTKNISPCLPWQQAAFAAKLARTKWQVDSGPISNDRLSEIFCIPTQMIQESTTQFPVPIAAGYRENDGSGDIQVFLNKRHPYGRRFTLARLIADHLLADVNDKLLPATEAKTARQKFQRAFAQEFLCPFENLIEFLGDSKPNDEKIEDAAAYFEVSPLLTKTLLVNRGLLERDVLQEY